MSGSGLSDGFGFSVPSAWRHLDPHVLLEVGHRCSHGLERDAARKTRAPHTRRYGAAHEIGRRLTLGGDTGGDEQSRDVSVVRDEHLAHETEATRLAENGQARALGMLDMNHQWEFSQSGVRVASWTTGEPVPHIRMEHE